MTKQTNNPANKGEELLSQLFQQPEINSALPSDNDLFIRSVMQGVHRGLWLRSIVITTGAFLLVIVTVLQALPLIESLGTTVSHIALSLNISSVASASSPDLYSRILSSPALYPVVALIAVIFFPLIADSLEQA